MAARQGQVGSALVSGINIRKLRHCTKQHVNCSFSVK